MSEMEEVADTLADELDRPDRSGLAFLHDDRTGSGVVSTALDGKLLAITAQNIDRNPRLIRLFIDALSMVKEIGNNRDHPDLQSIIILPRGKH